MIDSLGHPITAGCTVITPGYWSPTISEVVKVKKVTATYVHIEMDGIAYSREAGGYTTQTKQLRRKAHQVLVIDKQLKYNRKAYPESLL